MADIATNVLSMMSKKNSYFGETQGAGSLTIAKSPRMVPGADARGLVAPRRAIEVNMCLPKVNATKHAGAEHTTPGFDGITAFPDHGADGAAQHV